MPVVDHVMVPRVSIMGNPSHQVGNTQVHGTCRGSAWQHSLTSWLQFWPVLTVGLCWQRHSEETQYRQGSGSPFMMTKSWQCQFHCDNSWQHHTLSWTPAQLSTCVMHIIKVFIFICLQPKCCFTTCAYHVECAHMFEKKAAPECIGFAVSVFICPAFLSISALCINVSFVLQAFLVLYIFGSSLSSECTCVCVSSCSSVALLFA
jgi:hypothetical protein